MSRYLSGLLALVLLSPAARAEDVSFTASVDRAEVGLGERVRLIVSISAEDPDKVKNLKLPDTAGMKVVDRAAARATRRSRT